MNSMNRSGAALLALLTLGGASFAGASTPAASTPGVNPAAGSSIQLAPVAAPAQTPDDSWKTAVELPAVDFSGLTPEQKNSVLAFLRGEGCGCGCGMMIAECRIKDRNCPASPKLAAAVIQGFKDGKTPEAIKASLATAYQRPTPPPPPPPQPTLGTPVEIPIAGAPFKGDPAARVTLVEFSDFQCPFCSQVIAWADSVVAAYPKDVKLVFKQYPLPMHKNARIAAQASLAAHAQGKFWPLHDKMFGNFRSITREAILGWARELGLEMERFTRDMDDAKTIAQVDRDMADGTRAGVQGTPSFFLNGKRYNGGRDLNSIKPLIEAELKGTAATAPAASPAPPAAATKKPAPTATPAKSAPRRDEAGQ